MPVATFLVEDSPTIRDHLIPALRDLGNAEVVASADSERQATRWLRAHGHSCQLAVIDLFLKEGSGLGVLKACREARAPQRVVVLSNYATLEMRRQAFGLGAHAVFDKSTELDELFAFCRAIAQDLGLD
ncbi:response regulator [Variovorax sp. ZT4R33]|uniref:response regulator n=1 Tax=Variovorax sp. ZT4R33 TaxID=3443743 RepID=UPI003F45039D